MSNGKNRLQPRNKSIDGIYNESFHNMDGSINDKNEATKLL